jgi:outer membrane protein TolC
MLKTKIENFTSMSHPSRIAGPFLLTLCLTSLIGTSVRAQHVTGSRRKTDSIAPLVFRVIPPASDSLIQARLVQLALEGPQYQSSGHKVNIAQSDLSRAKRSWLNLLAVSGSLNDQSFQTPAPGGYTYPKYFVGLTIPIGLFFSLGPQIQGARESVEVSKNIREETARSLKAEVLSKYKQYKNYEELLSLENTIVVDQQTAFAQTEKKFKDGTATIEQYNLANKLYSDEMTKKLNLQLSQDLIKLDIERLIGTNLDNVTK